MSNKRVIVDGFILVAAAAGKVFKSVWNELTIRSLSIVLADIDDAEVLRRSMRGWATVEKLDEKKRRKLKDEVARGMREDRA